MKENSGEPLPPGWTRVALADVVRPSKEKIEPSETKLGTPYLSLEHIASETGEIIARGTSADVCSTKAVFRPGDVLYGKLRPYLNKVATPNFAGICSTDIIVFPPASSVLSSYLAFYLRTREVVEYANHNSNGVQLPRISFEKLGELQFPLPPLAEQRRIVEKVEAVLARVNAARDRLAKVRILLKRFRQSTLAAACSGRLTADWCDTLPNKQTTLAQWSKHQLGDLFKVTTGGTPSRNNRSFFEGGTIPWIKTGEVKNCDISAAEEYITPQAIENSSAKVFPAGTLLVALYGEGKTRGQIGKLTIPAATNQACAALVNEKMDDTTRRYVFTFLLAQYYVFRERSAGGNQPNLSVSLIRKWEIDLPPLAEQHEIVRRVEALFALADKIEARVSAASARADKLIQSTLAKAFHGELVPCEPALPQITGHLTQQLEEGLAVLYALSLLHTWKVPTDRRAFELGMILMQNDSLRQRVVNKQRRSTSTAVLARQPIVARVGRMDEFIGELIGSNTLTVQNIRTRQLVSLGASASSKAALVKQSVGANAFVKADEATRAVQMLSEIGQSLEQYASAEDYDPIEITIS